MELDLVSRELFRWCKPSGAVLRVSNNGCRQRRTDDHKRHSRGWVVSQHGGDDERKSYDFQYVSANGVQHQSLVERTLTFLSRQSSFEYTGHLAGFALALSPVA